MKRIPTSARRAAPAAALVSLDPAQLRAASGGNGVITKLGPRGPGPVGATDEP